MVQFHFKVIVSKFNDERADKWMKINLTLAKIIHISQKMSFFFSKFDE